MKKLITLMSIALIMFSIGCKKDSEISIAPVDLLGSWELRDVKGGYRIAGPQPFQYNAGNGNVLRFTETGYEKLLTGQPAVRGTYELRVENFYSFDNLMTRIIYDGNEEEFGEYLEMIDGKLKIHRGIIAADGTESLYEKITEAN